MATWFSLQQVAQFFPASSARDLLPTQLATHPEYRAAAELVFDLMQIDPNAVRRIRSQGFRIGSVSSIVLEQTCPALPRICLENLPALFSGWTPPTRPA